MHGKNERKRYPVNSSSERPIRILHVEDSEDDALLLSLQLKRDGYQIVSKRVDTLDAVKAALAKLAWDIIISDYMLPGFSGLDTLRLIQEQNSEIPCIIVSGKISDETAVEAMKAGATDYVLKDNLVRLGPAIERALNEAKKKQELKAAQEKLRQYYQDLEEKVQERTAQLMDNSQRLEREIEVRKKADAEVSKLLEESRVQEEELRVHQEELQAQTNELNKASEAIRESEARFRSVLDNSRDFIYRANLQTKRYEYVSPSVRDILGFSVEEFLALSVKDMAARIHPDDLPEADASMQGLKGIGKADVEYRQRHKDGHYIWISNHMSLIKDAYGQPLIRTGNIRDVTERKMAQEGLARAKDELERRVQERTEQLQEAYDEIMRSQKELSEANKQLKEYGHRITQVQEEERKRIAYELHDDTAQYLSILKLEIEALIHSGKIQSREILDKLEFLRKDAERAFNDVRRYSHELRPGVLEHLGLQAALDQITEDINKLKQVPVEFQVDGIEPNISEDLKLAFFRIAQEALNNARKHAKASRVGLMLKFNGPSVQMIISDDGAGFDYEETLKNTGGRGSLGLMSMSERANLVNANLKIESEPGKGTKVILKARLDSGR
jgi:PAS domain S-box-containing protein